MNQQLQPKEGFLAMLKEHSLTLPRVTTNILQVNLGRLCNQVCEHCHQGAGPTRKEMMDLATVDKTLSLLDQTPEIEIVDFTGGAPEMNPHFKYFVTEVKKRGLEIIDRCNLTVLFEPEQAGLAEFLSQNKVKVVASMPCYGKKNVDGQRGDGVFEKSIQGLRLLNSLGYGKGDLTLDLVYNPGGAFLPGSQSALEQDYKTRLLEDFGIVFSNLFTITNMPIRRFSGFLKKGSLFEDYQNLLLTNFNPEAAKNVMCRSLVSVDYAGRIYDCDFNQAMDFEQKVANLDEIKSFHFKGDQIAFGDHCFGCTAGAGSSCGGALEEEEA